MDEETKAKLNNLVAFLVLMQGNGGVATKAPPYLVEKFESYTGLKLADIKTDPQAGWLDMHNHAVYDHYAAEYGV